MQDFHLLKVIVENRCAVYLNYCTVTRLSLSVFDINCQINGCTILYNYAREVKLMSYF